MLDEIDDPLFCEGQRCRHCAQGQEPRAKNTEGAEAQGPVSGTKAVLTAWACSRCGIYSTSHLPSMCLVEPCRPATRNNRVLHASRSTQTRWVMSSRHIVDERRRELVTCDQIVERNRKKELRTLANRISTYGRKVHQRYPTGEVVVRAFVEGCGFF